MLGAADLSDSDHQQSDTASTLLAFALFNYVFHLAGKCHFRPANRSIIHPPLLLLLQRDAARCSSSRSSPSYAIANWNDRLLLLLDVRPCWCIDDPIQFNQRPVILKIHPSIHPSIRSSIHPLTEMKTAYHKLALGMKNIDNIRWRSTVEGGAINMLWQWLTIIGMSERR